MSITPKEIKERIDQIVIESDSHKSFAFLDSLFGELIPEILRDYNSCRTLTQFSIGQLERVPSICATYLFYKISQLINAVQVEDTAPAFVNYVRPDDSVDVTALFDRICPYLAGEQRMYELHPEVADALSIKERQFVAYVITQEIQSQGVKSQWTDETFKNFVFLCNILYSICKKDNVMGLMFYSYNNILDRLNTSGFSQYARDLVEGLLIVGYNEGLEADAYFSACRAYTGANNVIGGALFYYISLCVINKKAQQINKKFAFDLYWQYLKLCRAYGIYPKDDIDKVIDLFEKIKGDKYDRMSFYHTLYYTRLRANKDTGKLVADVAEFLDSNREAFFENLEHGAMPWIALLVSLKEVLPDQDFSVVMPYVIAARQVASKVGNELLFDLLEETNLSNSLKELQYKLQNTRNTSDYTMDNENAMIVAKKLLNQAFLENNPSDFLLSMSPKTDFSMVLPNVEVDGIFKRFDIKDVDGNELNSIYNSPDVVNHLICTDDHDIIYWIGRGKKEFLIMTLFEGQYSMSGKINLLRENVKDTVGGKIAGLRYERTIKDAVGLYVKSDEELEQEGQNLAVSLKEYSVTVPKGSERLIFIKDLEIASYPHNLFVEEATGVFVSTNKPCCNALSTEVLFKTNTSDPLPEKFSKSFWIPYGAEELTFDMIHGKLEDVIREHGIDVQNTLTLENPISADITMLCAHGGSDISNTEVFYVDKKPIIDILPCIGIGKVAILFVCYSGSISRTSFDNAMHALAKKMIIKGYSSVVAPMWSLNIDIIKPWLSVFLDSMENGEYIIDAVFKANMSVKQEFVAPSAWACLHLFGNPYTRVAEVPRLRIELN